MRLLIQCLPQSRSVSLRIHFRKHNSNLSSTARGVSGWVLVLWLVSAVVFLLLKQESLHQCPCLVVCAVDELHPKQHAHHGQHRIETPNHLPSNLPQQQTHQILHRRGIGPGISIAEHLINNLRRGALDEALDEIESRQILMRRQILHRAHCYTFRRNLKTANLNNSPTGETHRLGAVPQVRAEVEQLGLRFKHPILRSSNC